MKDRKKVFIIDDDVDSCTLMKVYFLRKNYEVYIAHRLYEALPLIKKCQPNLIYLDIAACQNPEEDIKEIKKLAPDAEIHYVPYTG